MDTTNRDEMTLRKEVQSVLSELCISCKANPAKANFKVKCTRQSDEYWNVYLSADYHESVGTGRMSIIVKASMTAHDRRDQLVEKIGPWIRERARLERRARAIKSAGQVNPAWSYVGSEILRSFASYYKIESEEVFGTINGTSAGERNRLVSSIPSCRRNSSMTAKVTVAADLVKTDSLQIKDPSGKIVLQLQRMGESNIITIPGVVLADTVIQTLTGRQLADVVDHPALQGVDIPVLTAGNAPEGLRIAIKAGLAPMGPIPKGADTGWFKSELAMAA